MFRICGPKCSLCCTIISIWGIIQLALMGGFFYTRSVSLAEDLGIDDEITDVASFLKEADTAYQTQAYKCWVAVAIYVATLVLSLCQLYVNKKSSYQA